MAQIFDSALTFRRGLFEKASFLLLVYLDFALTLFAVSEGFSELNPVMQRMLQDPAGCFLFKGALSVLVAWVSPGRLLLPAIAFMAFVVGWDVKELLLYAA